MFAGACFILLSFAVIIPTSFAFNAHTTEKPYPHWEDEPCKCEASDWKHNSPISYRGTRVYLLEEPISPSSPLCSNATVSEFDVSRDFFRKRHTWERPLVDARKPVDVEIRLVLQSINDIVSFLCPLTPLFTIVGLKRDICRLYMKIEKDKLLRLTGYLSLFWWDEMHVWNKSFPHACLSYVVMDHDEVWIPELAMTNSPQHYELLLMYEQEKVLIYSNGLTSYKPGGTFGVFCDFDLTYFPFDSQECTLNMESWRYTYDAQVFHFGDSIRLRYWIENEQWTLLNMTQRMGTDAYSPTELYSQVEFTLLLKRKVGFYMINVIIPSIIISVAEVATFTLPVDEVMKIHISLTCLVAYGIFQLMIIEDIPRTSDRIPLLSYYITLSMAYICVAMLGEGLAFICFRKGNDKRHKHYVPDKIYQIFCWIAKAVCVKQPKDPVSRNSEQSKNSDDEDLELVKLLNKYYAKPDDPSQFISLFGLPGRPLPHQQSKNWAPNNKENNMSLAAKSEEERHRIDRWDFLAELIDRLVAILYIFSISATPIIMFSILPKISHL